jgi:Ca-activated chloride channel family protein
MIEEKRQTGVFLSVLGLGRDNLRDSQMEQIADKGNGNYSYIDSLKEGLRVLVDRLDSTLDTVAKDVKIQVEFNPAQVAGYRLIGYENRLLAKEDFNDDSKDAGEIGAGHTVTALFEIVPRHLADAESKVDPLRYGAKTEGQATGIAPATEFGSDELLFVKLRYKLPGSDTSTKFDLPVKDEGAEFDQASTDLRFAAAVASFGMLLRDSPYRGSSAFDPIMAWAESALGQDVAGYRNEFLGLVRRAKELAESWK